MRGQGQSVACLLSLITYLAGGCRRNLNVIQVYPQTSSLFLSFSVSFSFSFPFSQNKNNNSTLMLCPHKFSWAGLNTHALFDNGRYLWAARFCFEWTDWWFHFFTPLFRAVEVLSAISAIFFFFFKEEQIERGARVKEVDEEMTWNDSNRCELIGSMIIGGRELDFLFRSDSTFSWKRSPIVPQNFRLCNSIESNKKKK